MSQLFTSGGQRIGVSCSTSVLPVNTQDWSDLLAVQGTLKSLLQHHSSKVVRKWAVGPNYFCEDARERGRKITTKYYPPFKNNTEHKVHIEGIFLNMMKAIYSQHLTQPWKAESISSKLRNKTRMPILVPFIQHCIEISSQSNIKSNYPPIKNK